MSMIECSCVGGKLRKYGLGGFGLAYMPHVRIVDVVVPRGVRLGGRSLRGQASPGLLEPAFLCAMHQGRSPPSTICRSRNIAAKQAILQAPPEMLDAGLEAAKMASQDSLPLALAVAMSARQHLSHALDQATSSDSCVTRHTQEELARGNRVRSLAPRNYQNTVLAYSWRLHQHSLMLDRMVNGMRRLLDRHRPPGPKLALDLLFSYTCKDGFEVKADMGCCSLGLLRCCVPLATHVGSMLGVHQLTKWVAHPSWASVACEQQLSVSLGKQWVAPPR